MKVGITGAGGFVGWHMRCYLQTREDIAEVRTANRKTFADETALEAFVDGLDLIVHLAGVNRAEDVELLEGNARPARQLVDALNAVGVAPCVILSSSTHAEHPVNAYGRGKAEAEHIFSGWAEHSGARFVNIIVPHVFGEYGRPFYNSAVATFCHQIVRGEKPKVNGNGALELVHIQNLVEEMFEACVQGKSGTIRVEGHKIGVAEVEQQLHLLWHDYHVQGQLPDLVEPFQRNLFNALRGAMPENMRLCSPVLHSDDRGWLVETVKAGSGGQCFVSTTRPGITRGNHFHRRKVERFFVLQGKAEIRLRKLFTEDVQCFTLDGSSPAFVDIPTLHTHCITNVGDAELITLFWSDEFFDPEKSDTYFEPVLPPHGWNQTGTS